MRIDHTAFYSSLFLSRLADQILLFVVPLVVFQVTQSAAWSGVAFFAETLPRFLSFPVCGALCDRVSPFRLLRISQTFRAVTCVLGSVASGLTGNVAWLVAVSAVCGVLTTQGVMAREVMLPQVFREFRTEKVLAYAQIADQLGMVLGPLVAALALDWWSWEVVLGVTLATSAAMVTGALHQSGNDYAVLQTGSAIATVVILLLIARLSLPLHGMGLFSYGCILLGGVATASSRWPVGYAIGFLMVIGFDKMFSIYIRTRRLQVIPAADLGKTAGLIVMLNNLTQPAAGLFVGLFAGHTNARCVIVAMTVAMGVLGVLALFIERIRNKEKSTKQVLELPQSRYNRDCPPTIADLHCRPSILNIYRR
jgi:MFS family permease